MDEMDEPTAVPWFRCEFCGKEFEPGPDDFWESGIGSASHSCDKPIPDGAISAEELERMSEYELREIGLTLEERDELLKTGTITTGASCICPECQKSEFDAE